MRKVIVKVVLNSSKTLSPSPRLNFCGGGDVGLCGGVFCCFFPSPEPSPEPLPPAVEGRTIHVQLVFAR